MPERYRTPGGRRLRPAGHALVTVVVALILALFMNSDALLETAERQPLGSTTRRVAVGIMEPVVSIGDTLLLDRPRALLDDLLGRGGDSEPVAATTTTSTMPEASTTSSTVPGTSTTVPATGPETVYTADDPLKVWVIGDSFVEFVGPALRSGLAETGVVETEIDFRFISGLIRRDVFDWPDHLAGRLPQVTPDVVIAQFGGNDGQETNADGLLVAPEDEAWQELYRERVLEVADLLLDGGVEHIYWLGLPIMRDSAFDARVRIMNRVYADAAASRDGVTFVDVYQVFQDADGGFSTYLEGEDGGLVAMRTPDGAHYTLEGAYVLADRLIASLTADLGLPSAG